MYLSLRRTKKVLIKSPLSPLDFKISIKNRSSVHLFSVFYCSNSKQIITDFRAIIIRKIRVWKCGWKVTRILWWWTVRWAWKNDGTFEGPIFFYDLTAVVPRTRQPLYSVRGIKRVKKSGGNRRAQDACGHRDSPSDIFSSGKKTMEKKKRGKKIGKKTSHLTILHYKWRYKKNE